MKIYVGNIICKLSIGGVKDYKAGDLLTMLREFMRARPKDYHRVPAYKKKQWDGYKYFLTPKGEFATGFLPVLMKYAIEELGATVEVIDERAEETLPVFRKKFNPFVEGVGNVEEGKYDYQAVFVKAVQRYINTPQGLLYFPRGIFDAATNAGKTSIMSALHNNIVGAQTLILIHRKDVFDELHRHFKKAHGAAYGYINGTNWKPGQITLAMAQTLSLRIKKSRNAARWVASNNVIIVDESQAAGSTAHGRVLRCAANAGVRIFMSGTPLASKDKIAKMQFIGLSGNVLKTISNKELIERGVSQKPIVRVHLNNTGKKYIGFDLEEEKVVHYSMKRVRIMQQIIKEAKGKSVLICFNNYVHGAFLHKHLSLAFPDLAIDWVHGKMIDRKERIDKFREQETQVLIGSTILQLGLNIKHIQVLVYALGGESRIRLKQFIGRGLRHDGINDTFEVHDFFDIGKYTEANSKFRMKVYREEEFEVEYMYPHKKNGTPIL